jgi:hypothetical protein
MLTAAGARALAAGSVQSHTNAKGDQAMANDTIPDHVRMKALKGFRGQVDGRFQEVKPGEIVTVTKELAIDLRQSQKAVMTTEEVLRHPKGWLPERKRPVADAEKAAAGKSREK